MKNLRHILSALGLALIMVGNAQAILLTGLFDGGDITAGDKLFDQWTLIDEYSSEGRTVDTDNIEVTALDDGGMDPGPGLQFDILNNEFSVTGNGTYAYLDFTFSFRVSVLDPSLRIKDNSLAITGVNLSSTATVFDNLGSTIIESIEDENGSLLGSKYVERSELVTNELSVSILEDTTTFTPQSEIWVTKNILVWATDLNETASLIGFTQRFSQTTVPEPGTLGLLALGCAGLICLGRKRGSY